MVWQGETGEDFTKVYEIRSVIKKVNWQQLLVVFPDTKPKDHEMKQGGSRSWRGDSFLMLLNSSLQNIVDAWVQYNTGQGHKERSTDEQEIWKHCLWLESQMAEDWEGIWERISICHICHIFMGLIRCVVLGTVGWMDWLGIALPTTHETWDWLGSEKQVAE